MASKLGNPGGIPERRVRPIWDAIDTRQFKNALKLSSNLVTKNPNSLYALALKALVLERMGKNDEALSVCVNAKELLYTDASIIADEITLSTLQIVLQRLGHLEMATSFYEYVCGKSLNNFELMMGLFNCYVREYLFVKQQQIAIKMYKIAPEERILLWAVCSIQLQVLKSNGGEKLLLFAEGLLKKHIASHSLHEPEALIVYISVLEQQSKYGDALEILSGELGSLIAFEVDKLRIQGRLLARAGDYFAAADVFQKVLKLCPDDWESFIYYLGCLLEDDSCWCKDDSNDPINAPRSVKCKVSHLTYDVFDSRISNAAAFVRELLEDDLSNSVRCPYVANLEIERRKLLYGKGEEEKLIEALMKYFFRFGHLPCFSSDAEMFLDVLTPEKKKMFLSKIGSQESPSAEPKEILGQFITVLKIQDLVGHMFTIPVGELEGSAVLMAKVYCKNLHLSKDLDEKESTHGEELLSRACNVLVQLFWRTRHHGYLLESILILEFGLTIRRHVSRYKILLLHLYSYWGALSLAYEWYNSLEVKNILLETVSHHMLPQMCVSPLWINLNDCLRDYLKFMDDYLREAADHTCLAYRDRSYSKAIEFVQFKERLQRSSQFLTAKIEVPILQLKQNTDSIEKEVHILESLKCGMDFLEISSDIRSKSLTFNEDLELRPWWTPTYNKNYLSGPFEGVSFCPREKLQKHHTIEMEVNVPKAIERRSLLPRLIYLSIHCATSSLKENIEGSGTVFDPEVSLELKNLLERYAKMLGYPFKDAIELVFGISSGQKSSEVLSSELIDWMNFAVFYNAWNLTSRELGPPESDNVNSPGTWHSVTLFLKKYILEKVGSIGEFVSSPGNDLPILVQLVTEPLAWHALVIQSCLRPSLQSGKKKKKGGLVDQSNFELSKEISDSIKTLCGTLEQVTKWLREQINRPVDGDFEILLSSIKRNGDEGPGQVLQVLSTQLSSKTEIELGHRICKALKVWNSADVVRKIVTGQHFTLSELLKICDSKIKLLKSLKQPVQH